ncbi:MAG: transketolase C-terminal domain-containing protein, partial [Actinomycetes bacterium]
ELPALDRIGGVDVLRRDPDPDVLIVSIGALAPACLEAAELLASSGLGVTVVDPRWVKPVDPALVDLARGYRLVVSVEDNGRVGGVGAAIAQALRDAGVSVPLRDLGIAQRFLEHGKRPQLLAELELTGPELAAQIRAALPGPAPVTGG